MKLFVPLLFVAALSGCTTARMTVTPDGRRGVSIDCSGSSSWSGCYEKAGQQGWQRRQRHRGGQQERLHLHPDGHPLDAGGLLALMPGGEVGSRLPLSSWFAALCQKL